MKSVMTCTLTCLLYHVVFSTKHRSSVIYESHRDELYRYIHGIVHNKQETLLEVGGMSDHIHLLLKIRASTCLSDVVRVIKSNSSKWMNEQRVGRFAWQNGYGAFTVSASQQDRVRHYIQNQADHHSNNSFQNEFLLFLKQHQISQSSLSIWD